MPFYPGKPLTPKQELFILEYLKDLNAAHAAVRAGYPKAGSRTAGSRLLKNKKIAAAIDAAKLARAKAVNIDAEWVLRKLKDVHDRVTQEVRPAMDRKGRPLKDEDGNVLYRFDAAAANRSLELIGKHVGVNAFQENVNVTSDADIVSKLMAGRQRALKRANDE